MPHDPEDSYTTLMRDIRKSHRKFTRAEELRLLEACRAGSSKARHALALSIMPMALKTAGRITYKLTKEELASAAAVGVMTAIDSHDTSRGTRLTTTAGYHVLKSVLEAARESSLVRVPREWRKTRPERVELLWRALSWDDAGGEDGVMEQYNRNTHPDTSLDQCEVDALLWRAVSRLRNARHKTVLRLRFRDGKTLRACAKELGICAERVRQVQVQAISKLRKIIKRNDRYAGMLG